MRKERKRWEIGGERWGEEGEGEGGGGRGGGGGGLVLFFNVTATTGIYTLSLHDALPICSIKSGGGAATRNGQ